MEEVDISTWFRHQGRHRGFKFLRSHLIFLLTTSVALYLFHKRHHLRLTLTLIPNILALHWTKEGLFGIPSRDSCLISAEPAQVFSDRQFPSWGHPQGVWIVPWWRALGPGGSFQQCSMFLGGANPRDLDLLHEPAHETVKRQRVIPSQTKKLLISRARGFPWHRGGLYCPPEAEHLRGKCSQAVALWRYTERFRNGAHQPPSERRERKSSAFNTKSARRVAWW